MKTKRRKVLSWLLVFAFVMSLSPVTAFAAGSEAASNLAQEAASGGTDASYVTAGTYAYTSSERKNIQERDAFAFREDCFMRSSFLGCDHLMLLSAQAAIASASRFGEEVDPYEKDPSDSGYNSKKMLTDMGFEDVETNRYASLEKLENSMGVCVGQRKIRAFGNNYTLLAILPRSGGYKQEWAGSFHLGSGSVHEGFKAGRDEVLRFVKQYLAQHAIRGNVKVWIAGHGRGGAIANLLGGFFAGGGITYFGDTVSITPEDVYCYAFAAMNTIREGADLAEALSVGGGRGGTYANDTPGESFLANAAGTVNPQDEIYGGIRNYAMDYDCLTYLPLREWGYTCYGSILDITEGLLADRMIDEMASVNAFVYDKLKNGGDCRVFREREINPATLSVIDKEGGSSGTEGMASYVRRLVTGFGKRLGADNQEYVDSGAQDAMGAFAGLIGMLDCVLKDSLPAHRSKLAKPALLGYLAYASESLLEEGKAAKDTEASAIVFAELLRYVTGKQINLDTMTVDELAALASGYIADHKDSELANALKAKADEIIPSSVGVWIRLKFGIFHPNPIRASSADILLAVLTAAANGADKSSAAYLKKAYRDPKGVRAYLYKTLWQAAKTLGVTIDQSIIGVNEEGELDGSGSVKNLMEAALPLLLGERDKEGNVLFEHLSFAEAADAAFLEAIDSIMADIYPVLDKTYPSDYIEMVRGHVEETKNHMTLLREILFDTLFYTGNRFSPKADISSLYTLINMEEEIKTAHYNEVFIAWAKAAVAEGRAASDHRISFVGYEESSEAPEEHAECWVYHDMGTDKKYKDRSLSLEGVLPHTWKKPTYKWSKDYGTVTATRVCANNPGHVQTEKAATKRKVTTPASVTAKGKATYTAVFKNPAFKTQKKTIAIPAIKTVSLSQTAYTYNGKVRKPAVTVEDTAGKKLKEGTDYTVKYQNSKSKAAGTYKVTVTFKNDYTGTAALKYTIKKAENKISIQPTTKNFKHSSLKKKNGTFTLIASVKENAAKTFSVVSVSKKAKGYIGVSKAGKVTVKKGLGKGTYSLQVKVTAAKTANYKTTSVTEKVKITVL